MSTTYTNPTVAAHVSAAKVHLNWVQAVVTGQAHAGHATQAMLSEYLEQALEELNAAADAAA